MSQPPRDDGRGHAADNLTTHPGLLHQETRNRKRAPSFGSAIRGGSSSY
jgi:hypothetical protein